MSSDVGNVSRTIVTKYFFSNQYSNTHRKLKFQSEGIIEGNYTENSEDSVTKGRGEVCGACSGTVSCGLP